MGKSQNSRVAKLSCLDIRLNFRHWGLLVCRRFLSMRFRRRTSLFTSLRRISNSLRPRKRKKLVDALVKEENISKTEALSASHPLKKAHRCYETVVEAFHSKCFNLGKNGYPLRKLQTFVNMCEKNVKASKILPILDQVCSTGPWEGAH